MRRLICRIGCCILLGLAVVSLISCERVSLPAKEEAKKGEPLPAVSKQGTVTISGEVIFKDYRRRPIAVAAWSREPGDPPGPPNISATEITKPGKYTLEVPANIGEIYLKALNMSMTGRPMVDTPTGKYEGNPLKVGSSDITGIDITISRKQ